MPFPENPTERSPKGDHNRRLALGIDLADFAARIGVAEERLKDYEMTLPDHEFDTNIAQRVGVALEQLERTTSPKVDNGPPPIEADAAQDTRQTIGSIATQPNCS